MSDTAKRLDGILSQKRAMNQILRDRRSSDPTLEPAPLRFKAPPEEEPDPNSGKDPTPKD
jgi:hypothetical protein